MKVSPARRLSLCAAFAALAGTGALGTVLQPTTQAAQRSSTGVPAPASIIGFEPCADYKLATHEQIDRYFRALAHAAPGRVQLLDIGPTTAGRPQLMAIISSEENIRRLGRFKEIARALALTRDGARSLSDGEARALAREGKAVVWIDFGLHSSEVAGAQTAPLVAHKLVSEESEDVRAIREDVIFLLVPDMNPDGTTMVADWYMRHVGQPWESRLPELYHRYAGHDDNRDWFMMTQRETRNVARQLYHEWFPQIVYDHHQAGPFPARIFVPPFDEPMNPNIPPLVMRGVNTIGDAIARRLDQEGKRGAVSRVGFDAWWNGGMRTTPYFHNMIGILTETSHPSATPATHDPRTFPKTFENGIPTLVPTISYPSPYRGGAWHLRDSCDYMVTASMAVLDIGARRREEWLYDIYRMGRDAAAANRTETFLVPAEQWDPGTAAKMINVLRLGGVDVERAVTPFEAGGTRYGEGTYVIRGAQPFAPYVRDLLTPQAYPDLRGAGGLPKQPYDITGWTLPMQMGVAVDRHRDAIAVRTVPVPVASVPLAAAASAVRASAPPAFFVIDPRANDAFVAVNRLLKEGDAVYRTSARLAAGGSDWPAGAFLVAPGPTTAARLEQMATSRGLSLGAIGPHGVSAIAKLATARIGVYHGWGGNIDEGWTRWTLEQFEFPHAPLHDADVRAGNLRARFDVIVLPDASETQMRNGLPAGSMPPEYTGGMTDAGVEHLRQFVAAGGTLVALDSASDLAIAAFRLPVRNVAAGRSMRDLYGPGTLVRLEIDAASPIGFGMPSRAAAFFGESQAFDVISPSPTIRVAARYAADDLLMSGWLVGAPLLAGRAAALDVQLGQGRVVLLGFRVQHRAQTHGTFKMLFNSLLLSSLQ